MSLLADDDVKIPIPAQAHTQKNTKTLHFRTNFEQEKIGFSYPKGVPNYIF